MRNAAIVAIIVVLLLFGWLFVEMGNGGAWR